MNKYLTRIGFAAMLFLLSLMASACGAFGEQSDQYPSYGRFRDKGSYLIEPDTILSSLAQGNTSVFTPMLATPGPNAELLPAGSVPWTQEDYLKIAKALSQLVWKETMEEWSIYRISFDRECGGSPTGYDSFDITYFKSIEVDSKWMYTARQIEIYPLAREASWGSGSNFPRPLLGEWNSIDLTKFKITADDALRIAETNGGDKARANVHNDCHILVSAPTHDNNDKWDVYYYPGVYFEMKVNPFTGQYEILLSK